MIYFSKFNQKGVDMLANNKDKYFEIIREDISVVMETWYMRTILKSLSLML